MVIPTLPIGNVSSTYWQGGPAYYRVAQSRVLPAQAPVPSPDPTHHFILFIGTAMRSSLPATGAASSGVAALSATVLATLSAALLSVLFAGCAPLPAAGGGNKLGLKHGWVSGFYTAQTPRAELPACLAALPPERLEGHLFVKVDYRAVRRMMVEVAEVPTLVGADGQQSVRLGDRVELWPEDCTRGRLSRITRLMPPAPPPAS